MTSGRVSRAGRQELTRNNVQETPSGVVIATPDSGFRISAFVTNIPGVFSIQAAEQVESLRDRWLEFVRNPELELFEYVDPTLAEVNTLTRGFIPHVIAVIVAFQQKVHPKL